MASLECIISWNRQFDRLRTMHSIPEEVGNRVSLLISFSIQVITKSMYSGPEQAIGVFDLLPFAHRYSKPGGNPSPAFSFSIPLSCIIPHIKLISLKKSTAMNIVIFKSRKKRPDKIRHLTICCEPLIQIFSSRQFYRALSKWKFRGKRLTAWKFTEDRKPLRSPLPRVLNAISLYSFLFDPGVWFLIDLKVFSLRPLSINRNIALPTIQNNQPVR